MSRIVVAFSGGLDTSFCAVWLAEQGHEVVTACVDTGGFSDEELVVIAERAAALGVAQHRSIDARADVYERFVSWLIRGNVLRGGVYPLSVGCERVAQAEAVARFATEIGADGVAHGSTGAGNDQVRFDVALAATAPDLSVHAPIRELNWSRAQEQAWLTERGVHVDDATVAYSLNAGLFGTTIGGSETHDSWQVPPESAYTMTDSPTDTTAEPEELVLGFEQGLPVSLDGAHMSGTALIAALNARGKPHGVGRGLHLGDTILGVKGRIAFEAPGPVMLITAHRELGKLVQTKWQQHWCEQVGSFYGTLLHEGLFHDPVMRDLEALLGSVNTCVTGQVRLRLHAGKHEVVGVRSPHSLMDAGVATYGEGAVLFTGAEAAGFARIHGLQAVLAARRDQRQDLTLTPPPEVTTGTAPHGHPREQSS